MQIWHWIYIVLPLSTHFVSMLITKAIKNWSYFYKIQVTNNRQYIFVLIYKCKIHVYHLRQPYVSFHVGVCVREKMHFFGSVDQVWITWMTKTFIPSSVSDLFFSMEKYMKISTLKYLSRKKNDSENIAHYAATTWRSIEKETKNVLEFIIV